MNDAFSKPDKRKQNNLALCSTGSIRDEYTSPYTMAKDACLQQHESPQVDFQSINQVFSETTACAI
jgi:hypothetical protein